jgi:hypothetical protein
MSARGGVILYGDARKGAISRNVQALRQERVVHRFGSQQLKSPVLGIHDR